MTALAPLITPEDLLHLPDEGNGYEIVDGRIRELDVSNVSSRVGARILTRLENHVEGKKLGYVFMSDNSYQCFPHSPGTVRRADVSFISRERMTVEQYSAHGHCPICPDLVVEVLSPNDNSSDVTAKRQDWLAAGAKLVWVADPIDQSVSVFRADRTMTYFRSDDQLTGETVLPGFTVTVSDLFRTPT